MEDIQKPTNVIPPWDTPPAPPEEITPKEEPVVQQPEVQEAKVAEEPKKEEPKVEHKYQAVRGAGDPIYLIVDNKKHWVINLEIFKRLGYKLGEEKKIEQSELATYLPGETITLENYEKYK